jgi:hypothetical protein
MKSTVGNNDKNEIEHSVLPQHIDTGAMKRTVLIFVWLLLGGGLCMTQAQSYSVDWLRVAGDESTSSNGQYSVSGTIGQYDAGPMSGGNYSLTGGFWAIFAVQTSGAPILAVTLGGPNTIVVSWLLSATNFVLEQNSDLTTTTWTPSGYPITTNGGMESITIISPPPGNLFFRLKQ